MRKITKGVYFENAYRSGNVGFAVTDDGAVLVDSPMMPSDAWNWLKRIASISRKGIAFLVNTDYHVERVLGNCFFPTPTIAHQLTWTEMQRYDGSYLQRYFRHQKERYPSITADLAKARIVLPELALSGNMTLYRGGRIFRLIHTGGHTPASIMVLLPKEQVLFAGDVIVNGEHPSLGQADSLEWLHALEMIRGMRDVDIIVPGAGDLCDTVATEALTNYIIEMRERVYEHYEDGCTRRETVDKVKMEGHFGIPPDRQAEIARRIRSSVERVYDEFKRQRGKNSL